MRRTRARGETGYARRSLVQLGVVSIALLLLAAWQHQWLATVYLRSGADALGWVLNGMVAALFGMGMIQLVRLFMVYDNDERAITIVRDNLVAERAVDAGLPTRTLVAKRYRLLKQMTQRRAVINHSALAATLVAGEASRVSIAKFVHNVLILAGVLGTIVSLSIALLGVSDTIGVQTKADGLGAVVQGLSTALSTTMTAIVAYLFFGYFFLRLIDTQAHIISAIEEVTTTQLLPRLKPHNESVEGIAHVMTALIERLERIPQDHAEVVRELTTLINTYQAELKHVGRRLDEIARLLRSGVRQNEQNRQ